MNHPVDRDRDDAVLAQLAEHGDVGTIPRPLFVWIYGSESDLEVVAERMAGSGWLVDLEDQGDVWVLRAEREQLATAEAIHAMSDLVDSALEGTNAEYDGWETSVERSN
jgi:hypothetical protein